MRSPLLRLILMLLVLSAGAILSTSGIAQNSNSNAAQETTIVGYIGDSSCGIGHMAGMGAKECTLMCIKGGAKFILADRAHQRVYRLDLAGQKKAREFAGQKVKITGRVVGRTIRVTTIEAAS